MIVRFAAPIVLCTTLLQASYANTPPPPMSFEEQVCAATHVFIGTAKNVRFVNASRVEMCRGESATSGGALTSCGAAEVDVDVVEVLFPSNWIPKQSVVYRFGGGLFSTESLNTDLEGQTYLFHVKADPTRGSSYVPSAPWVLGKNPNDKELVNSVLAKCRR